MWATTAGNWPPCRSWPRLVLDTDKLDVVADRGYFDSQEILACDRAGITVTLPKPLTSTAKGRMPVRGKQDFRYLADQDVYICPAGGRLTYRYTRQESGLMLRRYWTSACVACAIKGQCTPGEERRISRWEHEQVVEAVQRRLDAEPAGHAPAARDRRAPLRHHQILDGRHSLRDEAAEERAHRDGPERAGL